MSTETKEKLYTVEEFLNLEWDDADANDYELIEGRIVARPKSGVSGEHGEIVGTISHYLKAYGDVNIGQQKLGRIYSGASSNFGQPEGGNYAEPDVSFVLAGRTPPKFSGPIPVVPDLIVEVWSPSDTTEKIHEKIRAYQKLGVRLTWSVYMLEKFVAVYRLDEQPIRTLLDLNEELDGEAVLPGFKLKVSEIFK
jgi:Uma2 family endonuclease